MCETRFSEWTHKFSSCGNNFVVSLEIVAVEGESIVSLGKPSDYIVSKTFVRPPFKVFRV